MSRYLPKNNKKYYNNRYNKRRNKNQNRHSFKFTEAMFIKKASPTKISNNETTLIFNSLNIPQELKRNIQNKNYNSPTPIQDQTIQHIIDEKDILGIADTGSGKTAAFLIPIISKLYKNPKSKLLVITPTRELANQIHQELLELSKNIKIYSVQCIGGCNINPQIKEIKRGVDVVIGTPGRLKDLHKRQILNLHNFDTVVLDEVDRMLDMGFIQEIKYFIAELPTHIQYLCFSATTNPKIEKVLALIFKKEYIKVSVKTGNTSSNVEQNVVRIQNKAEKITQLEKLLNKEELKKVLIFANTKREVDKLDKYLYKQGYKVDALHGDKRQNIRQRVLNRFKSGISRILIATDVASRGLDINDITHVINYDVPMCYDDYVHRIGRTGRANKTGIALTFV